MENYIKTGEFSFIVKRNPVYEEFENYMNEINAHNISKKHYLEIINQKIKDLQDLRQILICKDESVKSQSAAAKKEIENDIMNICKTEACFEIEKTF